VLLGLAFEVYEPASQAMIADVVAPGQRVRAYSLFNAALAVGGMGAGLIAAWLGRWDLRWLFVADAVSCALCAVVMRIVLPDGLVGGRIPEGAPAAGGGAFPAGAGRGAGAALPAASGRAAPSASPAEGGRVAGATSPAEDGRAAPPASPAAPGVGASPVVGVAPWRDRALLTLLASGTVFAVIYLQVMVSLPLALDRQGLQPADAGLLFTASAVVVVAGQPLLHVPRFAALSDSGALAFGYVLLGAGLAGYAVAGSPAGYLGATLVWGLGDLIVLGRAMALAAALAPPGGTGRYLAVYGTSWGVAQFAAPLAGTQLLERAGVSALWTVMAGACAVLAAAQLAVVRPLVERTARNRTSDAASACRPPVPSA
jgi:predicted MFS family arabinose efflux permease